LIRKTAILINDFSGGMDTKTPIISMPLNKSPNMRNFHCAGVGNRLMKRGGYSKLNASPVESDNLDVYYPPGYQTTDYALRDNAARTQISQGFKCNTSYAAVTKVRLWLKKTGTPAGTDTITLEIQSDSSGVPSGTEVTNGVSIAIDISDTATLVTTGYSWVTFTFSSNPTLVAGTQYHLVLYGAYTVSDANFISWGVDNYDVIYPDGTMSVNDGSTWVTDTLYDACFEVYITGGAKGNDGIALWDFSSKNMLLGLFGTSLYKMDKNSSGNPDGVWDAVSGASNTWDTYTKLMLHGDGVDESTTITDEIGKTVTVVGNTQIDTGAKKLGSGSILFDGTGDYLTLANSADWAFDADFCVDFWGSWHAKTSIRAVFTGGASTMTYTGWQIYTISGTIVFSANTSGGAAEATAYMARTFDPTLDNFYHIAVTRASGVMRIFVDGVQIGATYSNSTAFDFAGTLYIGTFTDGGAIDGWLDEVRVSKGISRYTADFTAPTAAYSATSITMTSSRFWTMADWQSGRALLNTDIGLYTYLGTSNATVVSAAPVGKFVTIWKKYVFMAGIRGSPNVVRYSDLSDYATWTVTNSLNFDTSDGDVITGMRILKGKLYIFKRYSIHRVTYLGSNPTFQIDQVSGRGCPSHYTIKEVDMGGDLGTVLIFLTTDKKLAIFDGYNIQVISDVLTEETNDLFASADDQPLSFNDMNLRYADLFHATVNTSTQEYILYCVLGDDTSVNYAFVFDYRTGGIYPYDGQIFSSSLYALATNKVKKLYCSGYTGYTWLQESGNSDDDVDINAYWVSGKIKSTSTGLLNKNLLLGVNLKEITSSSPLSINFQYRLDWNVSWSTAQSLRYDHNDELAFGKTRMININTISNMLQVKIKDNSSNPAPTIYGFEMYGEPTPLGVSTGDRATT